MKHLPLYSDDNLKTHPDLIHHDNHSFDEIEEIDTAREDLADHLWKLISQLAQAKSPLAHALFYCLTDCKETKAETARQVGISRARFSELLKKCEEELADSKKFGELEEDEQIIFLAPRITKIKDRQKYTPQSRKKK